MRALLRRLLSHVDEEAGVVLVEVLLEIPVGLHGLESGLIHEVPDVILADGAHVQIVIGVVGESVGKPGQPFIQLLRLRAHVLATVGVLVLALESLVQHAVVVALVQDQTPFISRVALRCASAPATST